VGACHVETKSLDGETNLKGRSVPKMLLQACGASPVKQVEAISKLRGYVECEQPNAATTKFTGRVHLDGQQPVALSISNVLLRSRQSATPTTSSAWCSTPARTRR